VKIIVEVELKFANDRYSDVGYLAETLRRVIERNVSKVVAYDTLYTVSCRTEQDKK